MLVVVILVAIAASAPSAFGQVSPSQILESVPITLTNEQPVAAPNPFQQMVVIDSSAYSRYEAPNLQNVVWYYPNGSIIPAWIESGASSSSKATVWWLRLRGFPARSSLTVYMGFAAQNTSFLSAEGPTGEAPQLSPTYGEYDDGALVFNYYTDFEGTGLPSGWTAVNANNGNVTVDNGVKIVGGTHQCFGFNGIFFSDTYLPNPPFAVDYASQQTTSPGGVGYAISWAGFTSSTTSYATAPGNKCLLAQYDAGQNAYMYGTFGGSATNGNLAMPPGNTFVGVFTQLVTSTSYYTYYNYTQSTGYVNGMPNFSTAGMYWAFEVMGQEGNYAPNGQTINWFRIRAYPPGGAMPYYVVWPAGSGASASSPLIPTLNGLSYAYWAAYSLFWAHALLITSMFILLVLFSPTLTDSRVGAALRKHLEVPLLIEFAGFLVAGAIAYMLGMSSLAEPLSDGAYFTLVAASAVAFLEARRRQRKGTAPTDGSEEEARQHSN